MWLLQLKNLSTQKKGRKKKKAWYLMRLKEINMKGLKRNQVSILGQVPTYSTNFSH